MKMKMIILSDLIQTLVNEEYLNHVEITPHVKPTHGPCCTCQKCGYYHEDCVCEDNHLLEELERIAIEVPNLLVSIEEAELK